MTLSLKDLVRGWFFKGCRSNGNDDGLTHAKVRESLSRKSSRVAKTVLFVDDEPAILSMRRLVFEGLGYSVLTAISGEEALEALHLHQVDAVSAGLLNARNGWRGNCSSHSQVARGYSHHLIVRLSHGARARVPGRDYCGGESRQAGSFDRNIRTTPSPIGRVNAQWNRDACAY